MILCLRTSLIIRISTSAVVVIEKGNMAQMINKIPQAISSLGQSMQGQQ